MQSHASRHVCSEFLKDLHPDLSAPFPKEIIRDEIAVAYGRRGVVKLIAVLDLPDEELSDEDRAHALRVFNGLLSTQEQKTDAINSGASAALTRLVRESRDAEVRRLSCEALASLAQVLPGREAIVAARGMESLTGALTTSPEAAAGALKAFSSCSDGVNLLVPVLDAVVPALVTLVGQPKEEGVTLKACENAAATLAGIATSDGGVTSCLTHGVPRAIVGLAARGMNGGDFAFEERLMDCLEACASCLEQVAHHPLGKTAVREAEGIKMLGQLLTACAFHPGGLLKTTSALMAVSIEKESKVHVMLYAGKGLVKILKESQDERLVCNARDAIVSASEHLDARTITSSLLTGAEQKELLYRGPLPPAPPDYRYKVVLPYGSKE